MTTGMVAWMEHFHMGDQGILFKGEMVRAILREVDPKTQTRRLNQGSWRFHVGQKLWVRETWAIRSDVDPDKDRDKALHYIRYRADNPDLSMEWHHYGNWRPSIFMPRWASRITL